MSGRSRDVSCTMKPNHVLPIIGPMARSSVTKSVLLPRYLVGMVARYTSGLKKYSQRVDYPYCMVSSHPEHSGRLGSIAMYVASLVTTWYYRV